MQDKSVRCDQCGAEAWVSVNRVDAGQLDFCGHDYERNRDTLLRAGWIVTSDERHLINEKPSVSANV